MTAETSPCTPEEFWEDDETPHTGHPGADLSGSDVRHPLEPTNVYIRRLVTERNEARAEVQRWTEKANEAGAAYALANSKHHAELDRANRLERMADRLAGQSVENWERAEKAETEVARLTAIVKPCFCGGEHHA